MIFLFYRRVLGQLSYASIFAGWVVRGYYRRCWMFAPYLVVVWVGETGPWVFPSLHTWDFYFAKEGIVAALKVLLAFELYLRLFAGLPGVRRIANLPLLGLLVLTLGMLSRTYLHTEATDLFFAIVPVATVGITLIFTLILGLAAWFRVPALPIHRSILRGLVVYQLVSNFGLQVFSIFGFAVQRLYNNVVPGSYTVLLMYWAVVVWRGREEEAAPPAVVQRLRAWAS